ncbi:MAG TPA: hypothetical protein VGG27_09685 [Magnetospirillaceae bacterium]
MRLVLGVMLALLATPALADQSQIKMDYDHCLDVQVAAVQRLNVPPAFPVRTKTRRDLLIATSGGKIIISCDGAAGTLTIATPPGVSVLPFIGGGG